MTINDLYDAVYYINLEKRPDRRKKFWECNGRFLDKKRTMRVEACDARNTSPPQMLRGALTAGNLESLMLARTAHAVSYSAPFVDALRNGYKKIFILEDDAEPLFQDIETFFFYESRAEKLGYDMFYAGGQIESALDPAEDYLYRINKNVLATQAISFNYNEKVFEKLAELNNFNKTYEYFTTHTKLGIYSTDEMISEQLTPITKAFISKKILFGQYPDHSDIECRNTNNTKTMKARLKTYEN